MLLQNKYCYSDEKVHSIYEIIHDNSTSESGKKIVTGNNLANTIGKYVIGYSTVFELPTKWDKDSQISPRTSYFRVLQVNIKGY